MNYYFDDRVGRYRSKKTGRFVSENRVINATQDYIDIVVDDDVNYITDRFIDGKLTLQQWQQRMKESLYESWKNSMTAGRGGKEQLTQSDYGRFGGYMASQYRHLANFAWEIEQGKLTEAQIRARARLYGRSARTALWNGVQAAKEAAGMNEERRVLAPECKHCPDCQYYASLGWVVIGLLPPPGAQCQCGPNCKCKKEYRRNSERI